MVSPDSAMFGCGSGVTLRRGDPASRPRSSRAPKLSLRVHGRIRRSHLAGAFRRALEADLRPDVGVVSGARGVRLDPCQMLVEPMLDRWMDRCGNIDPEPPPARATHAHHERCAGHAAAGEVLQSLTNERTPGKPFEVHAGIIVRPRPARRAPDARNLCVRAGHTRRRPGRRQRRHPLPGCDEGRAAPGRNRPRRPLGPGAPEG